MAECEAVVPSIDAEEQCPNEADIWINGPLTNHVPRLLCRAHGEAIVRYGFDVVRLVAKPAPVVATVVDAQALREQGGIAEPVSFMAQMMGYPPNMQWWAVVPAGG